MFDSDGVCEEMRFPVRVTSDALLLGAQKKKGSHPASLKIADFDSEMKREADHWTHAAAVMRTQRKVLKRRQHEWRLRGIPQSNPQTSMPTNYFFPATD